MRPDSLAQVRILGPGAVGLYLAARLARLLGGDDSNMDYVSRGPGGIRGPQGLPLLKPPYGSIVAIDLNTGEHLWRVPNGDTPKAVKEHSALQGVKLPVTGKQTHATVLVTKSLLLYGEGRSGEPLLHALDKKTGKTLWKTERTSRVSYASPTLVPVGKTQHLVCSSAGSVDGYDAGDLIRAASGSTANAPDADGAAATATIQAPGEALQLARSASAEK